MNVSLIIIAITVVVSFYAFSNQEVMRRFIMNPYLVKTRRQYYRFISSGFLHKDHIHLIFNMIALYFFGPIVETIFTTIFGQLGSVYFVILYLISMVVADIPSYFKHANNPGYNSLGASGAVSAVVFAFILFLPLERICIYFVICINGFILGIIYLIYSYYQGRKGGDLINHDAHFYGAVFGLIFCIILYPRSIFIFWEQLRMFEISDLISR
jgi:membrane associated rhomboid family serine protease